MKVIKTLFCVWLLTMMTCVSSKGETTPNKDEDLVKKMTEKLDEAIKNSASSMKLKIDPEVQAALDEYDIHLDVEDNPHEAITPDPGLDTLSLDSPPSQWPGHGQPFGSVGNLSQQVETIENVIKSTTFINRHVMKGKPLLLQGLLSGSPGLKMWDVTYLSNAPPSAMSNISVYDSGVEQLPESKLSMRDFIQGENRDLFMFDQIPSFLMKDMAFPQIFKCDKLLSNLKKHLLVYYKRRIVTEPVVMSDDRLICSVIGQSSYVLVPENSWLSFARNETIIDYSAVDYNTHPWLRQIQYFQAPNVKPGDCLYVPRNWYVQSSHADIPTSYIVFTWKKQVEKVSKSTCGQQDLQNQHDISAYSSHFSGVKAERDAIQDALIHYFVFYLGDKLSSSFTLKQFMRKIKRDKKLFNNLVNWTDEVEEISGELFELLDVNLDGKFSLTDIINMNAQTRDVLLSQIQDRLHDLGAVMEEQQKVKTKLQADAANSKNSQASGAKASGAKAKTTKPKQSAGAPEDVAAQFKEELQKEVDKMIREMEESEKMKNKALEGDEPPTPNPTREEIKRKAKAKATKRPEVKNTKTKEKENYKVVEEEEIEIMAEDDEDDIKEKSSSTKKSTKPQKSTNSESSNQKSSKLESSNQKSSNSKSSNQKLSNQKSSNQKSSNQKSSNQKSPDDKDSANLKRSNKINENQKARDEL